jgi:hypothetical protein
MLANGTLVINGGVGISKNLSINGNINLGKAYNFKYYPVVYRFIDIKYKCTESKMRTQILMYQ